MEKKHRCRLCCRNFANGRALGGHMRFHMMKFYAEEKALNQENCEDEDPFDHRFDPLNSYSSASLLSSSSSEAAAEEEEEEDDEEEYEREVAKQSYELRENPRKSVLMVDNDFSSVVDGESEAESSEKNPVQRRSSRVRSVRRSRISDFEVLPVIKKAKFDEQSSPVSSISDAAAEEHMAHLLIMLSRDKWENEERECQNSGEAKASKTKFRGRYRCEECNRLFKSYQALGGHRASHKKIRAPPPQKNSAPAEKEAKLHKCPFCDRIFSSGQALGGHKRSHFVGANAIPANSSTIVSQDSRIAPVFDVDLNLPAPIEDDEGSQLAISAVSDINQ